MNKIEYSLGDVMEMIYQGQTIGPYVFNLKTSHSPEYEIQSNVKSATIDADMKGNALVNEMWYQMISKYFDMTLAVKRINTIEEWNKWMNDENFVLDWMKKQYSNFLTRFYALWFDTKDYYLALLNGYATAKDKLLDKVKIENENYTTFNDTPQNENVDESLFDDKHMTTISKNKSIQSSDYGTMMTRLAEIQNSYKRVMASWVREFRKLFIEGDYNYE